MPAAGFGGECGVDGRVEGECFELLHESDDAWCALPLEAVEDVGGVGCEVVCLAGGADVACAPCEVVGQWAEVLFVEGVEDVGAVGRG